MKKTITHMLLNSKERPENHVAFRFKHKRCWHSVNWSQHFTNCAQAAGGLHKLGVKKGDKVAIFSQSRYEWTVCDMAIMGLGAITVPIYQSSSTEEIEFILQDSGSKVLICEDIELYKRWKQVKDNCSSVEHVVIFQNEVDEALGWQELLDSAQAINTSEVYFQNSCANVSLDDLASIVYTSGTTGMPKGVVLTHRQVSSEITELFQVIEVNYKDTALTFLPFAHVLARVEMWGNVYAGYTLAFAESIDRIKNNLTEISPTFIVAVPRIFEKIYNGIVSQVETNLIKKKIFNWSVDRGREISQQKLKNKSISLVHLFQYKVAQRLVFNTIKQKMGGKLRFAMSGGAPLAKEIAEFFHSAGLLICEGYGLTETTAAVTVNSPLHYKFGSVGKPIGDVKIKFAEDKEILIQSQKVMKEYYNNPKATDEVFKDGYFCTGDIGHLTEDGFLCITDRKKDLIKTAGGKYIAPQKLENLLKINPYISNVLIHGDQRKYVVALITLDSENVLQFARNQNIPGDIAELSQHSAVRQLIREAVAEVNAQLPSFETIKNFDILPHDFTIESGELTPSLKVKRKICDQKYRDILDSLFL